MTLQWPIADASKTAEDVPLIAMVAHYVHARRSRKHYNLWIYWGIFINLRVLKKFPAALKKRVGKLIIYLSQAL